MKEFATALIVLFIAVSFHWTFAKLAQYYNYCCSLLESNIPAPWTFFENVQYTNRLFTDNFIQTVQELREKYGRIFVLWIGGVFPLVFVMDVTAIREILTSSLIFEKGTDYTVKFATLFGEGLVTSNGETHKKSRSILGKFFSRKAVDSQVGMMQQLTLDTLNQLETNVDNQMNKFDMQQFAHLLTFRVICRYTCSMDLLAISGSDYEKQVIQDVCLGNSVLARRIFFKLPVLPSLDPNIIYLKRKLRAWHGLINQMCEERVALRLQGKEVPTDCLQALLDAKSTRSQICDQLTTLMVAGFETTANLVALAAYRIARFPTVQEKVRCELQRVLGDRSEMHSDDIPKLSYLHCVLKETMRLSPIIPVITRECNTKTQLDNVWLSDWSKKRSITIPKGCNLLIPFIVTQRDNEIWKDAHLFIPERFEDLNDLSKKKCFFPFGYGSRACIGNILAMTEAIVALSTLIRRYRFEIIEGLKPKPVSFGISLSTSNGIFISLRPVNVDKSQAST